MLLKKLSLSKHRFVCFIKTVVFLKTSLFEKRIEIKIVMRLTKTGRICPPQRVLEFYNFFLRNNTV